MVLYTPLITTFSVAGAGRSVDLAPGAGIGLFPLGLGLGGKWGILAFGISDQVASHLLAIGLLEHDSEVTDPLFGQIDGLFPAFDFLGIMVPWMSLRCGPSTKFWNKVRQSSDGKVA